MCKVILHCAGGRNIFHNAFTNLSNLVSFCIFSQYNISNNFYYIAIRIINNNKLIIIIINASFIRKLCSGVLSGTSSLRFD